MGLVHPGVEAAVDPLGVYPQQAGDIRRGRLVNAHLPQVAAGLLEVLVWSSPYGWRLLLINVD